MKMELMHPGVIPMLAYEDGVGAIEWLCRAFGFSERTRMVSEGRLTHGELDTGDGLIMLATPTLKYQSPAHHRETCAQALEWSAIPYIIDGVLVHVTDVTAHFGRAVEAGATILSVIEPDDHGVRYRAEDLEGHRWMFMQR
jgi:PhnB protein